MVGDQWRIKNFIVVSQGLFVLDLNIKFPTYKYDTKIALHKKFWCKRYFKSFFNLVFNSILVLHISSRSYLVLFWFAFFSDVALSNNHNNILLWVIKFYICFVWGLFFLYILSLYRSVTIPNIFVHTYFWRCSL